MTIRFLKKMLSKRASRIERKYFNRGSVGVVVQYCTWIRRGYKIYRKQQSKDLIAFCPYRGTGDVYLSLSYFRTYLDNYIGKDKKLHCL